MTWDDDASAKLFSKVEYEANTGCWLWSGCAVTGGYGTVRVHGRSYTTHRLSHLLHKGPIPQGMCVCHRCDTPACINPEHIFLGSVRENNADRDAKGRGRPYRTPRLLTADQEREIVFASAQGMTQEALAAQFQVSQITISRTLRRTLDGRVVSRERSE